MGCTAIISLIDDVSQDALEIPSIYYDLNFIGVITVGIFNEPYIKLLNSKVNNIISLDHIYSNITMKYVVSANLQGGYTITKHVIDQGHKRIGFVGSVDATSNIFDRWCGYTKAMRAANLPILDKYSILSSSPLTTLFLNPSDLLSKLKDCSDFPTAYICGGYRIAISLIEALKILGKQVPIDISIAGFDDIEIATLVSPALTTVKVKRTLLGITAVDELIKSTNKKTDFTKISIFTDLIIRESIKKLN